MMHFWILSERSTDRNEICRKGDCFPPEDTVVIITSDHGGHDNTHHSDQEEDMTIPLVIMRGAAQQSMHGRIPR